MSTDRIRLLGDKALREISVKISSPTSPSARKLAGRLRSVLHECPGFGLSAPQIGVNERMFVMGTPRMPAGKELPYLGKQRLKIGGNWGIHLMPVINPVVLETSLELEASYESCLSLPGVAALVPRHIWIEVEFKDLEGQSYKRRLRNHPARVFQHEFDHLEGIMFTDRILDTTDIVAETYFDGFHENGVPLSEIDDPRGARNNSQEYQEYEFDPDLMREYV